jgi:GT2 family glycosyltransferase
MLEQIGLLDEGYYTYCDDTDLCLRAKRAGWETWYVPESKVIHLEGKSTGTRIVRQPRPAYWYQAHHRYFLKNHGALYTALVEGAFIVGHALWQVRRRLQRRPDNEPPRMLIDSIRHSIFCKGPKLQDVENPALRPTAAQASETPQAAGAGTAPHEPVGRRPKSLDSSP